MFQLLLCTFLLPWQTQSCSYPWQILLQRLLSQLVTEVGDECWHHWLIRDRSWYFSEKWDVIGRKWIGLESKSKQFMCWSFVMEEEELVEGLEGEWHEQTFLSFVLSVPMLFFWKPRCRGTSSEHYRSLPSQKSPLLFCLQKFGSDEVRIFFWLTSLDGFLAFLLSFNVHFVSCQRLQGLHSWRKEFLLAALSATRLIHQALHTGKTGILTPYLTSSLSSPLPRDPALKLPGWPPT